MHGEEREGGTHGTSYKVARGARDGAAGHKRQGQGEGKTETHPQRTNPGRLGKKERKSGPNVHYTSHSTSVGPDR